MTRLLCQARSRQVGSDYAAELLSRIGKTSAMTQPSMQLLVEPLTAREMDVLRSVVQGKSNQQIADAMVITIATVKAHISNILAKLQVSSRAEAIAYAIKNKVVSL